MQPPGGSTGLQEPGDGIYVLRLVERIREQGRGLAEGEPEKEGVVDVFQVAVIPASCGKDER